MSELTPDLLIPDWPVPAWVKACVTTRGGGVSLAPYHSLNLGDHVGDVPAAVAQNRRRLTDTFDIQPAWLKQVHGLAVAHADPSLIAEADASWTATPGIACTVMTADCLPVLFCDRAGTRVAAAHAGWRGLVGGVLEATLHSLGLPAAEVLVWLGPAIGPQAFEVGSEVRDAFLTAHPKSASAFVPGAQPGKFLADIYALARHRMLRAGVAQVHGGEYCTVANSGRFYSFRRDGVTGRQASLIWLK